MEHGARAGSRASAGVRNAVDGLAASGTLLTGADLAQMLHDFDLKPCLLQPCEEPVHGVACPARDLDDLSHGRALRPAEQG